MSVKHLHKGSYADAGWGKNLGLPGRREAMHTIERTSSLPSIQTSQSPQEKLDFGFGEYQGDHGRLKYRPRDHLSFGQVGMVPTFEASQKGIQTKTKRYGSTI